MRVHTLVLTVLLVFYSSTLFAQRLTVTADIANIRSGPGQKYDVLWQVEKYHPIWVIDKTGRWLHFRDFEGDEGWIHASLVSEIPSVITKSEKCNVRSGPGTGYKILFAVEKGIPFRVLQQKNNWVYVRHADGDKGWVHNSLLW
ncbi:MAG: SH3 domain-containing protein [Deltaproteobacteria bacterium]|jgi:SH3-like domain-containing protein|nr:MAG: SH3 domain-containing protein [Deltaproteobacteria bacterium]